MFYRFKMTVRIVDLGSRKYVTISSKYYNCNWNQRKFTPSLFHFKKRSTLYSNPFFIRSDFYKIFFVNL